MSGKKSKLLRRKAEGLLIDWIKAWFLKEKILSKITKKNLHEFLPEQTHIFANNKIYVKCL